MNDEHTDLIAMLTAMARVLLEELTAWIIKAPAGMALDLVDAIRRR